MDEQELKICKEAWEIQKQLFIDNGQNDMLVRLEVMVRLMGAEETYKLCAFEQNDVPEEACEVLKYALIYLEYSQAPPGLN